MKPLKNCTLKKNYPILGLCKLGKVSRAGYYKWLHREPSAREIDDKEIAKKNRRDIQG